MENFFNKKKSKNFIKVNIKLDKDGLVKSTGNETVANDSKSIKCHLTFAFFSLTINRGTVQHRFDKNIW